MFDNGLSLGLAAGYMDAYYTYLNPCLFYVNCVASQGSQYVRGLAASPTAANPRRRTEAKATFSPTYDFRVPNGGMVRLQADYTYVAHLFNDGPNTIQLERDATNTQRGHSLHRTGERYEFIVGATNITDDRYITVGQTNYAAGEVVASYNPPRMWYFTIRAKMP